MFGLFSGIYYWWPKFTGKLLDEGLGMPSLLVDADWLQPNLRSDAHARP
ncbi:MAG: hypothetical protein U0531_04710 [Dehalococcoidia bacterium]